MKRIRTIGKPAAVLLLLLSVFAVAFVVGCVSAQPHMQSALDHLGAARSELMAAATGKGGHRERAIELVDEAIREVEMGMDSARYR